MNAPGTDAVMARAKRLREALTPVLYVTPIGSASVIALATLVTHRKALDVAEPAEQAKMLVTSLELVKMMAGPATEAGRIAREALAADAVIS